MSGEKSAGGGLWSRTGQEVRYGRMLDRDGNGGGRYPTRSGIITLEGEIAALQLRKRDGGEVMRQTGTNLEMFTEQYRVGRRSQGSQRSPRLLDPVRRGDEPIDRGGRLVRRLQRWWQLEIRGCGAGGERIAGGEDPV